MDEQLAGLEIVVEIVLVMGQGGQGPGGVFQGENFVSLVVQQLVEAVQYLELIGNSALGLLEDHVVRYGPLGHMDPEARGKMSQAVEVRILAVGGEIIR
jgi:hypothetical protein